MAMEDYNPIADAQNAIRYSQGWRSEEDIRYTAELLKLMERGYDEETFRRLYEVRPGDPEWPIQR